MVERHSGVAASTKRVKALRDLVAFGRWLRNVVQRIGVLLELRPFPILVIKLIQLVRW